MEKEKKKIYKQWWFWLIIIFLIVIIGSGSNNISNNTTPASTNTNNIIENNTTTEEENNTSNVPSEDNYKRYVFEVFDKYYNGSYNISGDKSDWKIISTLNRTKFEGVAITNNKRDNFYIILEFSDDNYTDYSVVYFQIGNDKIIDN